jgi:hypothetical protein
MFKIPVFLGAFCAVLGLSCPAQAVGLLLTSQSGYAGQSLDLSAYANGQYNFTFGPKSIPGGITFTSNNNGGNSGQGSVIGQGLYTLGSNGSFDANPVYIGLDSATGYMTFAFATPQKSFGAFLNYLPGLPQQPTISTYDITNNLLSSFNLANSAPINTPGGVDQFAFRGIDEGSAVISSFRLSGSYVLATGTANGNIPPAPTPTQSVPEPTTAIGTLIGLATILGTKRWVGIGKHSAVTDNLDELEIQICRQNCKQIIDASSRFFAIDTVNKGSDCETDIYCSEKDAVIGQGLLMQVLDAESGEAVINIDREFADLLATKYPLSSRLLNQEEIIEAAKLLDQIC